MFKNHFKISFRNIVRNKTYAFINVTGLALSMACGIIIFTIVNYHLSFDNFHPNGDRIYRLVTEAHRDNIDYVESVPPPLAKAFRTDYTYAEQTANIATFGGEFVTIDDGKELKKFQEDNGISFAEAAYFDIFNYPLVKGNKATVLSAPNTGIITENIAKKYFGNADPIGKIFKLNNTLPVTITGVLKNLPGNTMQKSEVYISYPTIKSYNDFFINDNSWGGISGNLRAYVRLKPGVNPAAVEKVLPAYVTKYRPKSRNKHIYKLQPLADIHFDARYGGPMEKKTLWILSFIGLFIIITACVNFVNLATAQALKRSKEVGVRKVLGGLRRQLFWQFITETGCIAIIGIVAATLIATLVLPYTNDLFDTRMNMNVFTDGRLMLFLGVLTVLITFLAGSYPALVLAGFKPVAALKGKITQQNIGGFNTRRGLIVTQFAISQLLIIGMIVIGFQIRYSKTTDLGFNKDAVVMIPVGNDTTGKSINTFKAVAANIAGVNKISACYAAPASRGSWNTTVRYNHNNEDEMFLSSMKLSDDQYLSTFGVELAAGRNIYPSDTPREALINEAFVKKLNLTRNEDVLGKTLAYNGGQTTVQIVGVVKDFHDQSYHSDINAICISTDKGSYSNFGVKINMKNVKQVLPALEKAWNTIYPNQMYSYKFLDDNIKEFYETEQTMLTVVQAFAIIAIFIGCLGLYGLVMFMAVQKTKEIGIRKVLGSTIGQILWIFGKEFARLILIAFVVAAPVAWLLMNHWLEDYKYHISISPLFFVATILLMFVIAALTVGYQAARAALMNPVKAIKTE